MISKGHALVLGTETSKVFRMPGAIRKKDRRRKLWSMSIWKKCGSWWELAAGSLKAGTAVTSQVVAAQTAVHTRSLSPPHLYFPAPF